MKPISGKDHFYPLLTMKNPPKLKDKDYLQGWVNYASTGLWSVVAYFYVETTPDKLPPMANEREGLQGVTPGACSAPAGADNAVTTPFKCALTLASR